MPAAAAYTGSKHFIDGFSEALRADLSGTGVVVTQVCPGPVDSEFDEVAGSAGGMSGGPPQFLRISAEQCAREALTGFERGAGAGVPRPTLPSDDANGAAVDPAAFAALASGPCRCPSTDGDVRLSRLILTGAAVGTIIGTSLADLNRSHVFNAAWGCLVNGGRC
jgi:NAD(P)-dependent dehydrogenase (short-subunit alcohol dehydrogenase family)